MNLRTLYNQLDDHLCHDVKPSIYLKSLYHEPLFQQYPFDLLYRLRQTQQSPEHHPEGNVWNHVLLVVDEAAKVKFQSQHPSVLMWAALLHDLGKPSTTRVKKGKIVSYDHDKVGAELSQKFLAQFCNDEIFIDQVAQLVRYHMQILFVVQRLPFAEIPAMKSHTDVHEVALLGLCDRLGRTNSDRTKEENNIKLFINECAHYWRPAIT